MTSAAKAQTHTALELMFQCIQCDINPMMPQSDQREHVLMGSSAEDARLVAEAQTPAQQMTPVGVTIEVVMDDARETQSHVSEEGRVLHHVRVR